jgi:hypothetical protein
MGIQAGTAPFTSPRLRGEVDLAQRGRVRGFFGMARRPLIRLAASLLATFSPQAGRRKEEAVP